MNKKINIKTKEKNYSIEIENNSFHKKLEKITSKKKNTVFLVDKKVLKIFTKFKNYKKFNHISINCSEKIKSFKIYENITQKLLKLGIDRSSQIVAIGGGTLGDLSGFIASTVMRGIDLILIPTTLLSQVDSSIGGKNGINTKYGKNLVGTFYQPKLVIIDPSLLKTLPVRELRSGYAEIVKHSIINDKKFFNWLEKNSKFIFDLQPKILLEAIYKSIIIKRKFVLKDEKEKLRNKYSRAILNFGHTFGHALETFYNYNKKLTHGEAISIGMTISAKISYKLNYLSYQNYEKIISHLNNNNLPTFDKNMYNKNIFLNIKKDKKNLNGVINFVLINKIGNAFLINNLNLKNIKKIIK